MINANLLQHVVNASCDGIVVAEQEGDDTILLYVNPAFERLTGYSAADILYKDCRFLQNDDREQPALDRLREAIRTRQPCREVLRNYRKDGSVFWNELSITPVYNDADQRLYFIGVQKDVSQAVGAQARILQLEAELAQVRQEIDQLRAGA